jgi:hypothetical protein
LTVDLQRLVDERVEGVTLERFTLQQDELRFDVALSSPLTLKQGREER